MFIGVGRMTGKPTERDLRIDFLRGICLLVIYTRHVRPNVLREYMPSEIGFSDAAEAFIFLSGFVSGRVYSKAMQTSFIFCQVKALRRAWQIYVAHIFTLFFNLALIPYIFNSVNGPGSMFFQDPSRGLLDIFLLCFYPYSQSILALYIFFVPPVPLMLWLGRKITPWGMILFSFLMYSAVLSFPGVVELPSGWSTSIDFNPFAWQFLFFVAVALGMISGHDGLRLPKGKVVICGVLAGLLLLFLVKYHFAHEESPWRLKADSLPWGKADLEPLRLIHFALVAYFCWAVMPRISTWYQWRIPLACVRCGQNSLTVFCFGVCLTNLANETLQTCGSSTWLEIALNVCGWILTMLFGMVLHGINRVLAANPTKSDLTSSTTRSVVPALAVGEDCESAAKKHHREYSTTVAPEL
jgi:hypothetical protein